MQNLVFILYRLRDLHVECQRDCELTLTNKMTNWYKYLICATTRLSNPFSVNT